VEAAIKKANILKHLIISI